MTEEEFEARLASAFWAGQGLLMAKGDQVIEMLQYVRDNASTVNLEPPEETE